tara:strand:+ start:81790 stop:82473 length:684 start_codon:yes stop_codon:yes gene_type:complete
MNLLDKVPNEPRIGNRQAKGTRILAGRLASRVYDMQETFRRVAERWGCIPVLLPTIEMSSIYTDKAGPEVSKQMYVFEDKGGRNLCLRPEVTATCQLLGLNSWRTFPDLKIWYWQNCYRYEQPQEGRYREFRQFGVEVLNPRKDWTDDLIDLGVNLFAEFGIDSSRFIVSSGVERGLGLYEEAGFEFVADELGAQKQILGGGPYEGGQGFAIGVDRALLMAGEGETA